MTYTTGDTYAAYDQGRDDHRDQGPQATIRNPYVDARGRERSAAAQAYRDGWDSVYGPTYSDGTPIPS